MSASNFGARQQNINQYYAAWCYRTAWDTCPTTRFIFFLLSRPILCISPTILWRLQKQLALTLTMKLLRRQKKEATDDPDAEYSRHSTTSMATSIATFNSTTSTNSTASVHFGSYDSPALLKQAAKNDPKTKQGPPRRRHSLESYQTQNRDVPRRRKSINFGSVSDMILPPQDPLPKKEQEMKSVPSCAPRKMTSGASTRRHSSANFGSQCVL